MSYPLLITPCKIGCDEKWKRPERDARVVKRKRPRKQNHRRTGLCKRVVRRIRRDVPSNRPHRACPDGEGVWSARRSGRKARPHPACPDGEGATETVSPSGQAGWGTFTPQFYFSFTITFTIGASPMGSFVELPFVDFERLTKQQPDGAKRIRPRSRRTSFRFGSTFHHTHFSKLVPCVLARVPPRWRLKRNATKDI